MHFKLLSLILLFTAPGFVSANSLFASSKKACATTVRPTAIRIDKPIYPANEKKLGISGKSVLAISIDASGRMLELKVIKSSGNRNLDRAAMEALRYSAFSPGKCDSTSIGGKLIVNVVFP